MIEECPAAAEAACPADEAACTEAVLALLAWPADAPIEEAAFACEPTEASDESALCPAEEAAATEEACAPTEEAAQCK